MTSEGAQKGPGGKSKSLEKLSRQGDLNPRPTVYETVALPLSYVGAAIHYICMSAGGEMPDRRFVTPGLTG